MHAAASKAIFTALDAIDHPYAVEPVVFWVRAIAFGHSPPEPDFAVIDAAQDTWIILSGRPAWRRESLTLRACIGLAYSLRAARGDAPAEPLSLEDALAAFPRRLAEAERAGRIYAERLARAQARTS